MNTRPREQILTLIAITLTFASGATNVASFTGLGGVFTSVMTGNIVLSGLAVARGSVSLVSHSAVAIAGYIAGVALGTWIAHGFQTVSREKAADEDGDRVGERDDGRAVPRHVGWVLVAEFGLLAGLTVGWEVTGTRPSAWAQFCLLAVAAGAMGAQSSAVKEMGVTEVSTTFLTGTLTGLVSSLVRPGQHTPYSLRRFGVLIGLAAGAGLSGLLAATAPAGVPALPLGASLFAVVLAFVPVSPR